MLVCLTGKTGSGKSTVLNQINNLGYKTYEMDKYIHYIYQVNQPGYELIKSYFGEIYVNGNEVDRKKLGQLVFNHKEKLIKLNELMLPLIRNEIIRIKNTSNTKEIIFIELAIFLNHEEYFKNLFDQIVLVVGKSEIEEEKIKNLLWFKHKKKVKNPIKSELNCEHETMFNTGSISNLVNKINTLIAKLKTKQ